MEWTATGDGEHHASRWVYMKGSFKLTFSYGTERGGSPAWGKTENVCLSLLILLYCIFYFV